MTKKRKIHVVGKASAAVIAAGLLLFLVFNKADTSVTEQEGGIGNEANNEQVGRGIHSYEPTIHAFENPYLYSAIEKHSNRGEMETEKIYGGVVPHHDVASELIAEWFQKIATQNPKKIIIVAPNHRDVGDGPGITAQVKWQTPFGVVRQDNEIIDHLVEQGLVVVDYNNFASDHAINVLTPFVAHYTPDAEIVPILLSSTYGLEQAQRLANELALIMREHEGSVIVSSVDFSHYLSERLANEKDAHTQQLISQRDYSAIAELSSDYIDSPLSLVVLLQTVEKYGSTVNYELNHSNSARFGGRADETTSYITYIFK